MLVTTLTLPVRPCVLPSGRCARQCGARRPRWPFRRADSRPAFRTAAVVDSSTGPEKSKDLGRKDEKNSGQDESSPLSKVTSLWEQPILNRGEVWFALQVAALYFVAFPPEPLEALITWIGYSFLGAGALLMLLGARDLGLNLSPLPTLQEEHTLVTDGVYGMCRHPMYTGLLAFGIGLACATDDSSRFVMALLLYIVLENKANVEEKQLLGRYGDDFRKYCEETSKYLPNILKFRPATSFRLQSSKRTAAAAAIAAKQAQVAKQAEYRRSSGSSARAGRSVSKPVFPKTSASTSSLPSLQQQQQQDNGAPAAAAWGSSSSDRSSYLPSSSTWDTSSGTGKVGEEPASVWASGNSSSTWGSGGSGSETFAWGSASGADASQEPSSSSAWGSSSTDSRSADTAWGGSATNGTGASDAVWGGNASASEPTWGGTSASPEPFWGGSSSYTSSWQQADAVPEPPQQEQQWAGEWSEPERKATDPNALRRSSSPRLLRFPKHDAKAGEQQQQQEEDGQSSWHSASADATAAPGDSGSTTYGYQRSASDGSDSNGFFSSSGYTNGYNGSTNDYANGYTNGYNGDTNGYNGDTNGYNGDTNGYNGNTNSYTNGYNGNTNGYNGNGYTNGDTNGYNGNGQSSWEAEPAAIPASDSSSHESSQAHEHQQLQDGDDNVYRHGGDAADAEHGSSDAAKASPLHRRSSSPRYVRYPKARR